MPRLTVLMDPPYDESPVDAPDPMDALWTYANSIAATTGQRVLDAIADAVLRGLPPTYWEIGQLAGIASPSHVAYWLNRLERDGFITWARRKRRAIGMTRLGWLAVSEHETVAEAA